MKKLIYKIEGYTGVYNPETEKLEQQLSFAEMIVENPTEEDIDAYVTDFLTMYGEVYGIASAEDFYEVYSADDIRIILMQNNVINFLSENAKITETAASN